MIQQQQNSQNKNCFFSSQMTNEHKYSHWICDIVDCMHNTNCYSIRIELQTGC